MSRLLLALAALTVVSACGIKGDLERPDPMWNSEDVVKRRLISGADPFARGAAIQQPASRRNADRQPHEITPERPRQPALQQAGGAVAAADPGRNDFCERRD